MIHPKYKVLGIFVAVLIVSASLYFGLSKSLLLCPTTDSNISVSPAPTLIAGRRYTYAETLALHESVSSKLPTRDLEGHSGMWNEKTVGYRALVNRVGLKTVCEIGFNAGHSSLTWLAGNPEIHLYSFDLPHDYQHFGVELITEKFPGRLTLTNGNSLETIPKFFKEHPAIYCDIAHVDGGHDYETALQDLKNFFSRVKPGGIIIIDDTLCPEHNYCIGPMKAWTEFVALPEYKNKIAGLIYRYDIERGNQSGFQGGYVYSDD